MIVFFCSDGLVHLLGFFVFTYADRSLRHSLSPVMCIIPLRCPSLICFLQRADSPIPEKALFKTLKYITTISQYHFQMNDPTVRHLWPHLDACLSVNSSTHLSFQHSQTSWLD